MRKCFVCDLDIKPHSKIDFHKNCLKSITDRIESLETILDFGLLEHNNYLEMLSYVLIETFKKPLKEVIHMYKKKSKKIF